MHDSALFLLLTKLLPVFFYPLGLALALLVMALVLAWRGARRLSCAVTGGVVAGLWLASTPIVAEWSLGLLEREYPPIMIETLPNAEVAIVLGGAVAGPIPPRRTMELLDSSDRVLHASRLYRAGKVQRVLVVGGNLPWSPGHAPEAELIRDLLIEWGLPASAIEIGGQSRTTSENAEEARGMFDRKPFASALLITSASHMPRALATFRRAGLPVTPATTDVEVVEPGSWTPLLWLPDVGALRMTTSAMREWIGYMAYQVRGQV